MLEYTLTAEIVCDSCGVVSQWGTFREQLRPPAPHELDPVTVAESARHCGYTSDGTRWHCAACRNIDIDDRGGVTI